MSRFTFFMVALLLLQGCSLVSQSPAPVQYDPDVARVPDAVPRNESKSRYGNPKSYVVRGKRYHVLPSSEGFEERGIASWYGRKFHGRRTSSGETYDMYKMTAAHKNLPLPTYVEVTRVDNGNSVLVRVNDRGPFIGARIIDLSYAAAERLGINTAGTAEVMIRAVTDGSGGGNALAKKPKRPSVPAPVAIGQVYVQVGAFRERLRAEDYVREMERLDVGNTRIAKINIAEVGILHKVQVGPLSSNEAAGAIVAKLLEYGFEGFVVPGGN